MTTTIDTVLSFLDGKKNKNQTIKIEFNFIKAYKNKLEWEGLDSNEKYRNLDFIGVLAKHMYS